MGSLIERFAGQKLKNTRVVPVATKIILVFIIFIIVSNIATNYVNQALNQAELLKSMRQLLVKDLRELNNFCNTQHQIYEIKDNLKNSLDRMVTKSRTGLPKDRDLSVVLAVKKDGSLLFQADKTDQSFSSFPNQRLLTDVLLPNLREGTTQGTINFTLKEHRYFGIYKYNKSWDVFLVKAEETNEFRQRSRTILMITIMIVLGITIFSTIIGVLILNQLLKHVDTITQAIMRMSKSKGLGLIPLKDAPNDDVTFLGVAFNHLAATIDNLLNIFRKFASKDITDKAYREGAVRLEGKKQQLTCLFTDIKGFTTMTETLGTDIIQILNMHYEEAINEIFQHNGIIGSIIGDALLAVFGVMDGKTPYNKSYEAVLAAYKVHRVAEDIRVIMSQRKEDIIRERGALTKAEERIFQAVSIQVGVGLDGGDVFYGTIGASTRMTNTVIGDNVNSSARLEGLTRVYKTPVICSDYVIDDIKKGVKKHGIRFIELDTVQVKGKTIGKKVYWPILPDQYTKAMKKELDLFNTGLKLYYEGKWKKARAEFSKCGLPCAEVYMERTKSKCPKGWNGIWEMKTK